MHEQEIDERDSKCPFCHLALMECVCEEPIVDDDDEHGEDCECIKCDLGWDDDGEDEED